MRTSRGLMARLPGFRPGKAARPPEIVPASWTRYAELTGGIVATWLDEHTLAAMRLRDRLDDLVGGRDDEIRLPLTPWTAPDGTVGRIALPTPAQPSDLRLPLRLQLRISPAGGPRRGRAA